MRLIKHTTTIFGIIFVSLFVIVGCDGNDLKTQNNPPQQLRGASSYTPYDAHSMLWAKENEDRTMVWVSSGGEAGRLLVSKGGGSNRPDWVLCTQGVVAGLSARGEDPVIIATVYASDDVILPVYRKPRRPWDEARSLYIPRSSIEFAFDQLLERESVSRDQIRIPSVEKVGFTTIASMMEKPVEDDDALDFALLVDPFLSNLLTEYPEKYEIGEGGLYDLHYCVVARRQAIKSRRQDYVELLRQFLEVDEEIQSLGTDDQFYEKVWGRLKDGKPDRLPRLMTYSRKPARLTLSVSTLRSKLRDELLHLTGKYPNELKMPEDVDALVEPSLLREVAPNRVEP